MSDQLINENVDLSKRKEQALDLNIDNVETLNNNDSDGESIENKQKENKELLATANGLQSKSSSTSSLEEKFSRPKQNTAFNSLNNSVTDLTAKYNSLSTRFDDLSYELGEGLAMSAAMSAMPMPRNMGWNISAGRGSYRNRSASSIGIIYINNNTAFSIAHAEGERHSINSVGFTYNISSLFND